VVLPGGQAANVIFSIHESCRRLTPRQVHWSPPVPGEENDPTGDSHQKVETPPRANPDTTNTPMVL